MGDVCDIIFITILFRGDFMRVPATRPRQRVRLAEESKSEQLDNLSKLAKRLAEDPSISSFSLSLNKMSGVSKVVAKNLSGQTVTREVIAPGLETTMVHTPHGKESRNEYIVLLRERGLTQADIASRLDVSQPLVSNVLRKAGKAR